ncbi:hypothetical protein CC1G_09392 [Coprinopsis cinerea okayama7|uniref:HMG domain-containing protein n=1 Tax=Coprinopsis cinerea (strain Okayama-7 / 130 / ATCC MYA-4618 / FGSC 9003) TaxID=240176 RepID=A8NB32_COPC7|nr:hypothetical protein CC1G_09392 [Coprinopsis cinerea okayama7\|eukprot:XP_001832034.2 hypothetical protein CC1G_09392 [Coprinopsis cinerea okayama7\
MSHRYGRTGQVFMGEDLFRSVWFAYVALQDFGQDMVCSKCGDYPETVIWDGITLAFGRKHIRDTLRPPTAFSESALTRRNVKYHPRQQLIEDANLRKQMRLVLDPPALDSINLDGDSVPTSAPCSPSKGGGDISRDLFLVSEHLERIESVLHGLEELCPALRCLFESQYGPSVYAARIKAGSVYKKFFLQVAAEESVLQLVTNTSLQHLKSFIENPTRSRITEVLSIPGVYKLLEVHEDIDKLMPILEWIQARAAQVLTELKVERPLPAIQEGFDNRPPDDWKKTGCLYNMPQIRHRPQYPRLRNDQQKDKSSKRGDQCGKYYSQYGEQRLTGGIMVAWCTHSICYGFHCIAETEGRDDVFSAMITRWPVAPKRVVYDFACSLGPYCMLREPEFFQNTFFAIDHFHSSGHTKCSPAAFLSEYANVDPRLVGINSSAAECGNSSLKRIRKSVSYMSQQRAIIYTRVFLSVWNRIRKRRAAGIR